MFYTKKIIIIMGVITGVVNKVTFSENQGNHVPL